MELVKVKEKDLNLIKEFAKDYTLSDLFESMNSDSELEFKDLKDRYGYDKIAAIWLGHYEVEKTLLEVIKTQLETCLEQGGFDAYYDGYIDALSYCIRVIESRNVGDKS